MIEESVLETSPPHRLSHTQTDKHTDASSHKLRKRTETVEKMGDNNMDELHANVEPQSYEVK